MLLGVLPLGAILAQLRAMRERRPGRQALYAAGSGALLAALSAVWLTFYTYFWLMVLGGLLGALLAVLCPMRYSLGRRWQVLRGGLLSLGFSLLGVFIVRGVAGLQALGQIISVFGAVSSNSSNDFPFAYQFTGEMLSIPYLPDVGSRGALSLLQGSISTVLGCMGGAIPCLLAAAFLPVGAGRALKRRTSEAARHDAMIAVLLEIGMLALWLAAGVKLTGPRRRFAEIAVLPLAMLAGLEKGGTPYQLSRLQVWRDGALAQDTPLPGDGPAVLLIAEEGQMYGFACSPNLADSMLVRLFLCGSREEAGLRLLGTWYGLGDEQRGGPERRLQSAGRLGWATQVWQMDE